MSISTHSSRFRHAAGFLAAGYALAVSMAFSTLPTPLYGIYQHKLGFGKLTVTVVFAVFAGGVVASLLFGGHLSDRWGRRPVLMPAVLIEALAATVFLGWPTLPGLVVARVLTGLGLGLVVATATAYLSELFIAWRPSADPIRADQVATAANMGGLGLGPMASGLLAADVAAPLRTPYLILLPLLLLAAVGLALAPETVVRPSGAIRPADLDRGSDPSGQAPRVLALTMSPAARSRYFAAAAMAFVMFAVFGAFSALGPSFMADTLASPSHILAGTLPFVVFGAAATAQLGLARAAQSRQLGYGIFWVVSGLSAVTVGVWGSNLALFLIGAGASGAGAGILLKNSLTIVAAIVAPDRRGKALSGIFLAAYAGLTLPVIALGIAMEVTTARNALLLFTATILLALGLVGRGVLPAGTHYGGEDLRRPAREMASSG